MTRERDYSYLGLDAHLIIPAEIDGYTELRAVGYTRRDDLPIYFRSRVIREMIDDVPFIRDYVEHELNRAACERSDNVDPETIRASWWDGRTTPLSEIDLWAARA